MQHTGMTDHGYQRLRPVVVLCPKNWNPSRARSFLALGASALIGTLGGLIGLGGAEFRLPVLISLFRFRGLEAVILNTATSLVVVATALPFRAGTVPFSAVGAKKCFERCRTASSGVDESEAVRLCVGLPSESLS